MNVQFTTEDLENIRLVIGQKTKQIKNNIENLKSKTDLNPEKQQRYISEAEQDYANLSLIEAKCMRQLSDSIFKNIENG